LFILNIFCDAGNTCYLNSILQALFMTKQFCREVLVTERYGDRAIVALQELFALMLFSPRPEQNPKKVVNLIRPDDFLPGIQHDSSEFLGSLLDRLHEVEKKRLNFDQKSIKIEDEDWDVDEPTSPITTNNDEGSNSASSSVADSQSSDSGIQSMETDGDRKEESNDKIVDNTTNLHHTYVQRIFGGKISTRYLCSSCNGNSINIDSFRDLQLSFPERNDDENASDVQYNVQQLLEFYFTSEELTLVGDNQYHCDNCKILCNGIRYTEILEPPRNLVITLKHFRYDTRHHTRSKLLYKVFHDEILTVNVKGNFSSSNSSRNVEYKLYAAVIHSGTSLDSGHYFTIAREADNKWFKFNDSFVTKSSLEELRR
jgi:ubiquitin carboxyl-terminal hydrolase 35/38